MKKMFKGRGSDRLHQIVGKGHDGIYTKYAEQVNKDKEQMGGEWGGGQISPGFKREGGGRWDRVRAASGTTHRSKQGGSVSTGP